MTSIPDLDQLNPEQLRALAAQLLQRVSALDEQVETMGKTVQVMDKKIHHDKTLIEKLSHEIAQLKRFKFAKRSEQMSPEQASLLDDLIDTDIAAIEAELESLQVTPAPAQEKQKPKRRALPPEFPRTLIHHEPDNTDCTCGCAPSHTGTPQGGIISPVLANMTLDGLEAMLAKRFPNAKWTGRKMRVVRYADDFIITGCSKDWLENEVRPAVVEFLAERGLVLSPEKTKITHIGDGFDFLGWNLRKYNGKLLIKPSKTNIGALLAKLRELIKSNKTIRQANLIGLLNPVLRGWANYHSHVVAKKVFNQVDSAVWEMLWRWAVRRHPRKTRRWVKDRYFKVQGAHRWVSHVLKNPPIVGSVSTRYWTPRKRQLCDISRSRLLPTLTTLNGVSTSNPDGAKECLSPQRVEPSCIGCGYSKVAAAAHALNRSPKTHHGIAAML
ncbi:group II intron maturase-specific domain-containing protein [Pseudomonas fluorescens]|uniref:group II intron maturase-specific domain-containing protein n=1 Tax=Pseudomonas fluorescens TaxID=294 RepID=UPI0026D125A9